MCVFYNDPATTEIYTLSLRDALPICVRFEYDTRVGRDVTLEELRDRFDAVALCAGAMNAVALDVPGSDLDGIQYGVDFMKKRSEEHTSELQSRQYLVCRLLLEKKKQC